MNEDKIIEKEKIEKVVKVHIHYYIKIIFYLNSKSLLILKVSYI